MAIATIEEVFQYLDNALDDSDKIALRYAPNAAMFHHSVGRDLRNYLKLWSPNTRLTRLFRDAYDIVHPDDISSLLLGAYRARLRHEEYSIFFEAMNYRNHWRSLGVFEQMLKEFDEKK